jgi:hypothetical protein
MSKSSQDSHKRDGACNQQCPLIAADKAVTTTNSRPFVMASLAVTELQPLYFGYTSFYPPSVHQPATLSPPSLLSLNCKLTI